MTIREIIEEINQKRHDNLSDQWKIGKLTELDMMIYEDIVLRHEGAELYMVNDGAGHYTARVFPYTDDNAELIAPARFKKMYLRYLEAETDLQEDDAARYTNDAMLYESALQEFKAWYNETHLPIHNGRIITAPQFAKGSKNAYPFE